MATFAQRRGVKVAMPERGLQRGLERR